MITLFEFVQPIYFLGVCTAAYLSTPIPISDVERPGEFLPSSYEHTQEGVTMGLATSVSVIGRDVFYCSGALRQTIPRTWQGQVAENFAATINEIAAELLVVAERIGSASQVVAWHEENLRQTQLALGAGI